MDEKSKDNVDKTYTDPITGKFVVGNPGGGRPRGKKNFETEMEDAIKEFAKLNKITPNEVKLHIYMKGAKGALDGEYNFYRDFMDRRHGKPLQPIAHGIDGTLVVKHNEDGSIIIQAASEPESDNEGDAEVQGDSMRTEIRQDNAGSESPALPSTPDERGGVLVHSTDLPAGEGDSVANAQEPVSQAPETVAEKSE